MPLSHHSIHVSVCFAVCLLLLALQAGPMSVAQEVSPETDSASQWVSELASADPKIRREAESKILAAGDEALPAVKSGLKSFDLEISNQCTILLEKIKRRHREQIAKRFLEEDAATAAAVDLAAWPQFREFLGSNDLPTRRLFLEICDTLPSAFEDYGIRGEKTADALMEKANAILIKEQSTGELPIVSTAAFLFLSKLAADAETKQDDAKVLLDKADSFVVVEFLSSYSVVSSLTDSESRTAIEGVVADWFLKQKAAGFVSESDLFRFVYQTQNLALLEDLKARFDSFDASQKRKFIDVAAKAASWEEKKGWVNCRVLLEGALDDDTIAIETRLKKDPSEKIKVTVGMLAEGVLAHAIKQSVATGEPVKSEQLFGSYEFSGDSFSFVADDAERKKLADYLDSKTNTDPDPAAEPNQQQ